MEKDTGRYSSTRIDVASLINKENKKLDLDNLLGSDDVNAQFQGTAVGQEKEVRHISPGEYVVIISMVITSLYLLITSFFPLVYNIATSFEPINFLMNLFYFILGLSVLAGAFLVFRKETQLEHIADDTFDKVIYKRLEPVLRDVAVVQVGLTDVHNKLDMMNLNIERMGEVKRPAPTGAVAAPAQASVYIKYIVLINITLAAFLFMLQYPLEYIPYAITVIYIIWWAVISAEFKLWNVESAWMWVFIPILVLPVYTIVMNAYLLDYQMFGSLFMGLAAYVVLYYSWCSSTVRGVLPLDLHIALRQFKEKLKEKAQSEQQKTREIPGIEFKIPFKLELHRLVTPLFIVSVVLFAIAWFGFSIQHGLIPNVTWEALGMGQFTWKPLYSYAFTAGGVLFLAIGLRITFKLRRKRD